MKHKTDKILALLININTAKSSFSFVFFCMINTNNQSWVRVRAIRCSHLTTAHFCVLTSWGWIKLSVREEPGLAAGDQGSSPSLYRGSSQSPPARCPPPTERVETQWWFRSLKVILYVKTSVEPQNLKAWKGGFENVFLPMIESWEAWFQMSFDVLKMSRNFSNSYCVIHVWGGTHLFCSE